MKKVRWTLMVAIALGVYLGIEIASCDMENGPDDSIALSTATPAVASR